MKAAGIGRPLIGKIEHGTLGGGTIQRIVGNLHLSHGIAFNSHKQYGVGRSLVEDPGKAKPRAGARGGSRLPAAGRPSGG